MSLQISPTALAENLRSGQLPRLLEVREPKDYPLVALPRSILIPLVQLEYRAEEIQGWKRQ